MMGSGIAHGDDRAQAAAEAAISNPLLEDVNLAGACGILVNITAGPNLSMREFDEIGRVVHDIASEDATVVIGTAMDSEMQEEVRVTVVATGLNRGTLRQPAVATVPHEERIAVASRSRTERLRTGTDPSMIIPAQQRVVPAVPRTRALESAKVVPAPLPKEKAVAVDYIDIPTFLRKQAD